MPFGVRFVAPIAWKRVELSAGGGGLYEKYSVSNANLRRAIARWMGRLLRRAARPFADFAAHLARATPRFLLANPPYAAIAGS